MGTTHVARGRRHRNLLRRAGLRPVQIWVPDTRRVGFAAECQRQSRLVAQVDLADADLRRFMDEVMADLDGPTGK